MKPITESFVNKHLKRAAEALTPRKAEELWERPVEKAVGNEWYLDGVVPKRRRIGRTVGIISSLAACLAVCLLSLYMVNFRVDSTVYLDVNPSVTLRVNCCEKVIGVRANNPDGEIILEDMDLKHTDINVALNAVLGSMVKHGYLTEAKDAVLLSVSSGSTKKTEALRVRLSGQINDCLTSLVGSGTVFDQEVEPDEELEELAEKYGITPGKAALIQKIAQAHPETELDTLARLSVKELAGYLTESGADIRDYTNHTGASLDCFDSADDFDTDDVSDSVGKQDVPDSYVTDEADDPASDDADETDSSDYHDLPEETDGDADDIDDADDGQEDNDEEPETAEAYESDDND